MNFFNRVQWPNKNNGAKNNDNNSNIDNQDESDPNNDDENLPSATAAAEFTATLTEQYFLSCKDTPNTCPWFAHSCLEEGDIILSLSHNQPTRIHTTTMQERRNQQKDDGEGEVSNASAATNTATETSSSSCFYDAGPESRVSTISTLDGRDLDPTPAKELVDSLLSCKDVIKEKNSNGETTTTSIATSSTPPSNEKHQDDDHVYLSILAIDPNNDKTKNHAILIRNTIQKRAVVATGGTMLGVGKYYFIFLLSVSLCGSKFLFFSMPFFSYISKTHTHANAMQFSDTVMHRFHSILYTHPSRRSCNGCWWYCNIGYRI